ncbi:MAG: hypothetical protein HOW73_16325 [Polyangiaceae bacterium]|nr:hypothetical protein [Polyangiaceae bacterium]
MRNPGFVGLCTMVGLSALAGCGASSRDYAPSTSYKGEANYQAGYGVAEEAAPMANSDSAPGRAAREPSETAGMEPQARPGLGTEWGETRTSVISTAPFVRGDSLTPFATSAVFYNDEDGAASMASANGFRRVAHGSADIGGGVASVSLKDESGKFLSGFEASGKKFLVGEAGERYTIVIDSHVPARLEVVVSVDGLDVLDGREANFKKRGYIIDPHGSIEIDGFRQSMDTVAAFRFGAVQNSYASEKHGDTRNVGVIGVALFHEQGSSPSQWSFGETKTRLNADPFPGRFATPPR